ncbi:MAG: GAF domain-containing protein [Candidatus Dormibacteraeota bacterium]|uniref:GAF domain-containing protein n=1 Tax=Candidatus Dormiibacter inghamiae TaxID=3127013 RepID=A0A934KBH7_9BACT|nr:GAF domain-containing protein [Candidatus Dormibacteraeota bacterium]MBJ7605882.1 GAF domain-containing protein [Candidatus Dormibacteraeota bacterium]
MANPSQRETGPPRTEVDFALRELEFLQRLSRQAAATVNSDELLSLIIRETTSAMGTDVCTLYLLSQSGRELVLTATNGLNERMIGRSILPLGEGITGWVAKSRQPRLVAEVAKDAHWKWVPGLDEERFHSMLSVPIESGPRLVGVLNVQSVERRDFTAGDVDFLQAIAGQVAGILERSELQRRLEEQLREIQLSHDVHERFTRLSLEGAGIPAILEAVGALASGRAALYSLGGFRVRGAGDSSDGLPGRLTVPVRQLSSGAREFRIQAGRPARPLDVVPVRAGADLLGLLAVAVPEQVLDEEGRRRALEHGSTVLALELSKERAAAEVERRLRGDLVEEVLAGGLAEDEMERLAAQAERLGHRLPHSAWVIVIEPDDQAVDSGRNDPARQDRLDAALGEVLKRRLVGGLAMVRSTGAVVLAPGEQTPDLLAAEKLAEHLRAAAAPVLKPVTASAGVGNLARSVSELARSHVEARQALRLTRRAGARSQVTTYRSLGAFRLLLEVQSPEALRGFVSDVLGSLLTYAESRDTPLLETLEALAAARWVRRAAARALGIHINSINYRVERIEKLTGLSLRDPETRVAVAIALRAHAMLGV